MRLAVTASAVLAVSLLVLVTINSAPPPRPLVLFGAAVLHVWRSSAPDVASQGQRAAHLREVRSNEQSKRPAKSAA